MLLRLFPCRAPGACLLCPCLNAATGRRPLPRVVLCLACLPHRPARRASPQLAASPAGAPRPSHHHPAAPRHGHPSSRPPQVTSSPGMDSHGRIWAFPASPTHACTYTSIYARASSRGARVVHAPPWLFFRVPKAFRA